MNSSVLCHDTSDETHFYRYRNGIKFIKPNQRNKPCIVTYALENVMNLPVHVFLLKSNNEIVDNNELCTQNFGFASRQDAIGSTFEKVCANKSEFMKVHANDQRVMALQQVQIFDEIADLTNGDNMHTLSFKMPWYSDDNSVIGVFGCSTIINNIQASQIAKNITAISEIFLPGVSVANTEASNCSNEISYYSPRELEIMRLLVRGKTVREAADALGLSRRTVESYVENIKCKANVFTKSQLIDKIFDYFA